MMIGVIELNKNKEDFYMTNVKTIIKRDGKTVPFNTSKIAKAMDKAFAETNEKIKANHTTILMAEKIRDKIKEEKVGIEVIQDLVEKTLMKNGYAKTAKAYILYREERSKIRDKNSRLMKNLNDMVIQDAKDNDTLRENANVDGNTPMGSMLKFGSETAKEYVKMYMLKPEIAKAHADGDIHIHDMDFYPTGTTTCSQIDLTKLFENGFSTGHGFLRKPNSIGSYAALTAIAIQANQNDQHGGQSIPNLDRMLAPGICCSFKKNLTENISSVMNFVYNDTDAAEKAKEVITEINTELYIANKEKIIEKISESLTERYESCDDTVPLAEKIVERAIETTDKQTYQAMEGLVHNLNTMNSRAGAQVPFSSINYGTDTSEEGRMVVRNLLLATEAGLGNGETPIFPIHIFRCKHGINFDPDDPNYDLFKLACRVSAKRLFPNFSFQDAPFNSQYYKEGHPETEITYMGCRTRVIGNINGPEIAYGRGNLSFTSINLPRLGIIANGDWKEFYKFLDEKLELVKEQLLERFEYQSSKHPYNFPFVIQQGVWLGGEKLKSDEDLREVLKNGTLTIGFIGLAECLKAMMGVHHGESDEAQEKGLEIIKHMRDFTDAATQHEHLNFSLIATPAEGLSGRFTKIDKKKFGEIPGVTDRDYYTNSMHVPVYYDISAFEKIKKEAPYHALCNGGHIAYIELDGDPSQNLPAFEKIVRAMDSAGIGYGAINHPVDRDPCCGFSGIINDTCPKCGRKAYYDANGSYNGVNFDRIRRITGYLVGTLEKFNNGKKAEESDRVKHGL
jgi:ribonucleoside-triphosphate reductase